MSLEDILGGVEEEIRLAEERLMLDVFKRDGESQGETMTASLDCLKQQR